jgi:hypothetical protein
MKMVMLGGALAICAGGMYANKDRLFVPANVYQMPADALYQKLDAMEFERSSSGPMGTLDVTKHGEPGKSLTWSGTGAHAAVDCTATLVPLDAQRTQVVTLCGGGGPSEGAAAGMVAKMLQIAMVEQVDSTLRGRPYNKQKIQMQSAGAMLQALPKMEADALKMQHDIQQQTDAANADRRMDSTLAYDPNAYRPVQQPGQGMDPQGTDPTPTATIN